MYEDMTYEAILEDMLSRIKSDIDKREGSVIYDAIAPCAFKLAEVYFWLNNFINLVSGDTAVGEYLDRVVASHGIARKQATKTIRVIEATGEVDIGTRWGLEGLIYVVSELISDNKYRAECDQYGTIGNQYNGVLENIDNVNGVTATLTDIVVSGVDEETDDNLRARYFLYLQKPSTSGNLNNYIIWTLDVPGVGDAKVIPLWNGNGTVKVVIVDSDKKPVSEQLILTVAEHIEEVRPIGATVTVVSASSKSISVTARVSLAEGYRIQLVQDEFKHGLDEYRKDVGFNDSYISYAAINNILFNVEGVVDSADLTLNNEMKNIALGGEEIPIFDLVELEVM